MTTFSSPVGTPAILPNLSVVQPFKSVQANMIPPSPLPAAPAANIPTTSSST